MVDEISYNCPLLFCLLNSFLVIALLSLTHNHLAIVNVQDLILFSFLPPLASAILLFKTLHCVS